MRTRLTIGLFGFGCVGQGLYEVLNKSELLDARIKQIVIKDALKERSIDQKYFSTTPEDILNDTAINVVVELINDSNAAYILVKRALQLGKHVVTANKKLIAEHLNELLEIAEENGVSLLYEAAVAGAIPVIRNLEEYYNNDSLQSIEGILNGTTNYILTKSNEGIPYDSALKDAQAVGFAEADPTLDVEGFDARYKLKILARHGFGLDLNVENVLKIGITSINANDIKYASEKGYRIKLVANLTKSSQEIAAVVAPKFVEQNNPFYEVNNEFNAISIEGLFADKQLFIGKGAGSYPTASAVLSDISALKFDYAYEYKKSETAEDLSFTNEVCVKLYVGSPFIETINELPFIRIDEVFQSETYCYQTGWVCLDQLNDLNLINRKDLSIIQLPDPIKFRNESSSITFESKQFAVTF